MATKQIWTNSGVKNVSLSNIKDSAHLSYLNVRLAEGALAYSNGAYTTAPVKITYESLSANGNKFSFTTDHDLNKTLTSYTIYGKPTWYGSSKTYTNGNEVSTTFDVLQNHNIDSVTADHAVLWTKAYDDDDTAGSTEITYTTTNTNSYNPTTYFSAVSNSSDGTLDISESGAFVKVTAGAFSNSSNVKVTYTITATAADAIGAHASTTITLLNPTLSTGLKTIRRNGKTTVTLSDTTHSDEITWTATNGATVSNGIVTAGSDSGTITITALHGENGKYGKRYYEITVAGATPISIPDAVNTGDTVTFTLSIGDVKLKSSTGSAVTDTNGSTMSAADINAAFKVSGMTILSVTSDGSNWVGVAQIGTTTGTATIEPVYLDGTGDEDKQSTSVEDIVLTLE